MKQWVAAAGAAMLVAGCSGEATPTNVADAAPARLVPGEYEVTATVTAFRSTDKAAPVIKAKAGDVTTARGCVGDDGALPADLFGAKGESCKAVNAYARNGRLNLQVNCDHKGAGAVMGNVTGTFTKDGLKGEVVSASYFVGSGDYEIRQDIVGRRVGVCRAAGAAKA